MRANYSMENLGPDEDDSMYEKSLQSDVQNYIKQRRNVEFEKEMDRRRVKKNYNSQAAYSKGTPLQRIKMYPEKDPRSFPENLRAYGPEKVGHIYVPKTLDFENMD